MTGRGLLGLIGWPLVGYAIGRITGDMIAGAALTTGVWFCLASIVPGLCPKTSRLQAAKEPK